MYNIIRYFGKKNYDILPIVRKYGNIKTYCEPFSGSFTTGLNAAIHDRSINYIYNDIDYDIYNFWVNAKKDIFKIIKQVAIIRELIGNETELDEILHIIMQYKESQNNSVVDAAVTYILLNSRRFDASTDDKLIKDCNIDEIASLEIIRALQIVDIYNLDYKEIFRKVDSADTLYLIDPPYYVRKVDSYYKSDCRTLYHKDIANEIKKLKGKFILTYNINDYISNLYSEFNQKIMEKSAYTKDLVIWNFDMTVEEICKVCKFNDTGIYDINFDIDFDMEDT